MKKPTFKLLTLGVVAMLTLSGCGVFRVYTIDLPQGTPLTTSKAAKVQVGMTANQVLYILGSPALKDTLSPNRWDYIYDYAAGTDGKRQDKTDIKNATHYLSVYFNEQGQVVRVDGRDSLPATRP